MRSVCERQEDARIKNRKTEWARRLIGGAGVRGERAGRGDGGAGGCAWACDRGRSARQDVRRRADAIAERATIGWAAVAHRGAERSRVGADVTPPTARRRGIPGAIACCRTRADARSSRAVEGGGLPALTIRATVVDGDAVAGTARRARAPRHAARAAHVMETGRTARRCASFGSRPRIPRRRAPRFAPRGPGAGARRIRPGVLRDRSFAAAGYGGRFPPGGYERRGRGGSAGKGLARRRNLRRACWSSSRGEGRSAKRSVRQRRDADRRRPLRGLRAGRGARPRDQW